MFSTLQAAAKQSTATHPCCARDEAGWPGGFFSFFSFFPRPAAWLRGTRRSQASLLRCAPPSLFPESRKNPSAALRQPQIPSSKPHREKDKPQRALSERAHPPAGSEGRLLSSLSLSLPTLQPFSLFAKPPPPSPCGASKRLTPSRAPSNARLPAAPPRGSASPFPASPVAGGSPGSRRGGSAVPPGPCPACGRRRAPCPRCSAAAPPGCCCCCCDGGAGKGSGRKWRRPGRGRRKAWTGWTRL